MTLDTMYGLLNGLAGLFGALFGSFLNVCIIRMPEDRSVVWPGSACPSCGANIKPYDNVPVFAWLWLGGKCRSCKAPISPIYPIIEAFFAVLAVLLFRKIVPDLFAFDVKHMVAYGWYLWLLFALVGLTFVDLKHSIIPDPFSVYSIPVGVGGALLLGYLGYVGAPTWQQSVIGAATGAGMLAAVIGLYWLVRREEGMGFGDVKLLGLLGAYFGVFPGIFFVLFVAATAGSILGVSLALIQRKGLKMAIPFGPFLAFGAIVYLFFGDSMHLTRAFRFDLLFG